MKSDELHLNFAGGVFVAGTVVGYARYSSSMSASGASIRSLMPAE